MYKEGGHPHMYKEGGLPTPHEEGGPPPRTRKEVHIYRKKVHIYRKRCTFTAKIPYLTSKSDQRERTVSVYGAGMGYGRCGGRGAPPTNNHLLETPLLHHLFQIQRPCQCFWLKSGQERVIKRSRTGDRRGPDKGQNPERVSGNSITSIRQEWPE